MSKRFLFKATNRKRLLTLEDPGMDRSIKMEVHFALTNAEKAALEEQLEPIDDNLVPLTKFAESLRDRFEEMREHSVEKIVDALEGGDNEKRDIRLRAIFLDRKGWNDLIKEIDGLASRRRAAYIAVAIAFRVKPEHNPGLDNELLETWQPEDANDIEILPKLIGDEIYIAMLDEEAGRTDKDAVKVTPALGELAPTGNSESQASNTNGKGSLKSSEESELVAVVIEPTG